jgi:hypothetical protein
MRKREHVCMQELTAELRVGDPVDRIPDDRQLDRRQVDADLVCPPGLEPDSEQGVLRQQSLDLEVCDRVPRGVGVEGLAERIVAVAPDWSLDPASVRAGPPPDECEVAPLDQPFADEVLQPPVGLLGASDDEQPRRIPVEPVDDPRPLGDIPSRDSSLQQCVHERPAPVAGRRVNDEPRRLVDDQEMLVLVGDAELSLLGFESAFGFDGWLDLEQLAPLEPVTLRSLRAVDPDRARCNETLRASSRADLRQRRDEPVEPLPGRLAGNADSY